MTRNFTGMRSGGDGGNVNPIFARYGKHSAKKVFLDKARGIDDSKLTPEERYQKTFNAKMDELKKKALTGGSKYKFSLPGTSANEEKKLSKNMEAFIARAAAKQAREEEKKRREEAQITIKVKSFTGPYGGRIDAKGRIFGPGNKLLAKVNLKTGIVRNINGTRICKYKSDSPGFAEHAISQFIAKECNPNKGSWMGGTTGHAGSVMGNFYGTTPPPSGGMGSFYGHSDKGGGGFWG
jgi:hypothetical protein